MKIPKNFKVRPNFWLLPKGYRGMCIWPFGIYIRRDDYWDMPKFINHESIHWPQQRETLLIFFLLIYYTEMLYLRIFVFGKGPFKKETWQGFLDGKTWKKAYRYTAMEREAYDNDDNLEYLKTRKPWAWIKYIGKYQGL